MTKLWQLFSLLSVFALVGTASANEVLKTDQLDKVTAGGVAQADATAMAAAMSGAGNDVSTSTITMAVATEDAADAVHMAASSSESHASAGN
jgi:hypothetical protein